MPKLLAPTLMFVVFTKPAGLSHSEPLPGARLMSEQVTALPVVRQLLKISWNGSVLIRSLILMLK